jgi:hypothetical protein
MFIKNLDGYTFKVSTRKNKKYDVYKDNKYITSFGSNKHEQFYDKIGYYKDKNHNDEKRRMLYRKRHKNDNLNDKNSAGYFSWFYLW